MDINFKVEIQKLVYLNKFFIILTSRGYNMIKFSR